jgi:hypothetical protein
VGEKRRGVGGWTCHNKKFETRYSPEVRMRISGSERERVRHIETEEVVAVS